MSKTSNIPMITQRLLYFGIFTSISFWLNTLICGFILDYSLLTRYVSELGAVGTKTQLLFSIGVMTSSILNLVFSIGLYKACKQLNLSILPVFFIVTFSISMFGVSLFPMPLKLHGIFGPITLLLNLAPLSVFFLWKGKERLLEFRVFSILMFALMLLSVIVPRFIPSFQTQFPGLVQRLSHLGWSLWYISLSLYCIKQITLCKIE